MNAPAPCSASRLIARLYLAAAIACTAPATGAAGNDVRLLVQSSPLAGFQFHEGRQLWDRMQSGDALELVREPANPHDVNAVRVDWNSHKLGYVPRAENAAVARLMDSGVPLRARISELRRHRSPRQRIEFEIHAPL